MLKSDEPKSLRDEFAMNCPESWLARNTPKLCGDIASALAFRGIIPQLQNGQDAYRSYGKSHENKLEVALRYEYADAMMKGRK